MLILMLDGTQWEVELSVVAFSNISFEIKVGKTSVPKYLSSVNNLVMPPCVKYRYIR